MSSHWVPFPDAGAPEISMRGDVVVPTDADATTGARMTRGCGLERRREFDHAGDTRSGCAAGMKVETRTTFEQDDAARPWNLARLEMVVGETTNAILSYGDEDGNTFLTNALRD